MSNKEDIQQAVPIDSYIGRHVALKKAGRYLKGLCPFHSEKTPSFTVTPEKGLFHCFGCGRGGDIFGFVMEFENVKFLDALKILAEHAGIELDNKSSGTSAKNKIYHDLNGQVLNLYSDFLHSDKGQTYKQYIEKRGVGQKAQKTYLLGASPDEWNFVSDQLPQDLEPLEHLGLVRRSEKNKDRHYDFFRDRIMFPILDSSGKVAGFGGRALQETMSDGQKLAKYMNSPESVVFHKSRILYGLYQAISSIRQNRFAFVSEGYLDVIGLYQSGFENACAPLGTAITTDHFKILSRYTKHIVSLFDGDRAGREAALKFSKLALGFPDLKCEILLLPDGCDAMDISQRHSPSMLEEIFSFRIPSSRFLMLEIMFRDYIREQLNSETSIDQSDDLEFSKFTWQFYMGERADLFPVSMQQKRTALNHLYEMLLQVPGQIERSFFLDEAAHVLKLNAIELGREFKKNHLEKQKPVRISSENKRNISEQTQAPTTYHQNIITNELKRFLELEREVMIQVLHHPSLLSTHLEQLQVLDFRDLHAEILWRYLEGLYVTGKTWVVSDLNSFDLPIECLSMFNAFLLNREDTLVDLESSILMIKELLLKHSILEIKKEIAQLDARQHVADSIENSVIIEQREELKQKLKQLQNTFRAGK